MANDDALGTEHEITLPAGRLRYRERGEGPPVVFVHGLLVNGDLWRHVVPGVAGAGLRCLTPDWPIGAHTVAMPDADLGPPGLADLIAAFLDALDLHGVTLVANDTGAALVQILMARAPERVARVVLATGDCFEAFFPPLFAPLSRIARLPGGVRLLTAAGRLLPTLGYVPLSRRGVPRAVAASYLAASRDPAVRADTERFLRGVDRRHTLAAARELHRFRRPVLLAWAIEDRLFPISLAHRLAQRLPDATVTGVAGSRTFVPEDRPEELARLVAAFVRPAVRGAVSARPTAR